MKYMLHKYLNLFYHCLL